MSETGTTPTDRNGNELDMGSVRSGDFEVGVLRGANLRDANLRDANLRDANLRDANLRDADLRDANLRDANLRDADLRDADLRDADLRDANLRDANLRDANLRGADLRDADLRDANLWDANLWDADLEDATLPREIIPQTGSFQAYKAARGHIVHVEIPTDAARLSALGSRKCRADRLHVLEVLDADGEECDAAEAAGQYDGSVVYREGETAEPDEFDDDRRVECSNGLHFYPTVEEAIEWGV